MRRIRYHFWGARKVRAGCKVATPPWACSPSLQKVSAPVVPRSYIHVLRFSVCADVFCCFPVPAACPPSFLVCLLRGSCCGSRCRSRPHGCPRAAVRQSRGASIGTIRSPRRLEVRREAQRFSSTFDDTLRTSPSTCPDQRTRSADETNGERPRAHDRRGSFDAASLGLRLTCSIEGRSHGRLRLPLHRRSRLPTAGMRQQQQQDPPANSSTNQQNRPACIVPGTCTG